jgi:hypothetical protein
VFGVRSRAFGMLCNRDRHDVPPLGMRKLRGI